MSTGRDDPTGRLALGLAILLAVAVLGVGVVVGEPAIVGLGLLFALMIGIAVTPSQEGS